MEVGNGSGVTDTTVATVPKLPQGSWPTDIELVYVAGSTKVKLSLQSRLLQTIIRDAFENLRCALLFENAFPDSAAISRMIRESLVRAAEARTFVDGQYNTSAACVHQRLLSNEEYESKMVQLPRARIPIFRLEVKERLVQDVQVQFISIQPAEIVASVTKQLSQYTYTCPMAMVNGVSGPPRRTKLYRNGRIISAIRHLYFTGGSSAFARRFKDKFPRITSPEGVSTREVPRTMLALVATALYVAIREWRTGVHVPLVFSTEAYIDVYNGHIGTLEHLCTTRPGAFHAMMADVYNQASATAGNGPPLPIADVDLDGFEG